MPPAQIREHKFDVGIRRTAMQEPYRLSDNERCGGGANKGHRDGLCPRVQRGHTGSCPAMNKQHSPVPRVPAVLSSLVFPPG